MKKPRLIRDYEGGYVKCAHEIINACGSMPSGTIFRVVSSGIRAHLEALPCKCCSHKFGFSMKGKDKFDSFEWLGYSLT